MKALLKFIHTTLSREPAWVAPLRDWAAERLAEEAPPATYKQMKRSTMNGTGIEVVLDLLEHLPLERMIEDGTFPPFYDWVRSFGSRAKHLERGGPGPGHCSHRCLKCDADWIMRRLRQAGFPPEGVEIPSTS